MNRRIKVESKTTYGPENDLSDGAIVLLLCSIMYGPFLMALLIHWLIK